MADTESNKTNAGGRFGDTDWNTGLLGMDSDSDFKADSSGVPASGKDNKFDIGFGTPSGSNDQKSDLDMGLKPNMFPRQTGHDSLSSDEALLT